MIKNKVKLLNNLLNSGYVFSKDEYELQTKYIFSNIVLLVLAITLFILRLIQLYFNETIYSAFYANINLIAVNIALLTIILLRIVNKKYFYFMAHIAVFIFFTLIFITFILTDFHHFPIAAWFLVFIMAMFLIFNQKVVIFYISIFFIIFIIYIITNSTQSNEDIANYFIAPSILGYLFIYFYEIRTTKALNALQAINLNLEERINSETKVRTVILEKEKAHLTHLAHHDYLTGLPNMAMLDKSLNTLIALSKENKKSFALLYVDLDNFKKINDEFGHKFGNAIIKIIADRLFTNSLDGNIVFRVGGDEFLIVISKFSDINTLINLTKKYITAIEKEIEHHSITVSVSCSIGISIYPKHTTLKSDLIVYADRAMMKAKQSQNKQYSFYSKKINNLGYDEALLKSDMLVALEKEEFLLHFQPQINSISTEIVGIESLVRWQHPTLGLIGPNYFLNIAKNIGLMANLEHFIIKKSMITIKQWKELYNYKKRISINLTIQKLENKYFIDEIKELLNQTGCKGEWIEFEMTETEIISNISKAIKVFDALKTMNITIAIDDFGTGYSSLSYLKQLQIDKIKIDKIFVDDLLKEENHITIIDAIIAIAKSFNYSVITEGVENKEQVACLKEHGCHLIQGYYYHKPLPYKEIIKLL